MSRNLVTPLFEEPVTSRCMEWRDGLFSRSGRDERREFGGAMEGSVKAWFSWPRGSGPERVAGREFPESAAGPKVRFRGLFGEERVRVRGLLVAGLGLADRTESLTPDLMGVGPGA